MFSSRWHLWNWRINHFQRQSQWKGVRLRWWYARWLFLWFANEFVVGKRHHRWICKQNQRIGHTIWTIAVCESFTRHQKILRIEIESWAGPIESLWWNDTNKTSRFLYFFSLSLLLHKQSMQIVHLFCSH